MTLQCSVNRYRLYNDILFINTTDIILNSYATKNVLMQGGPYYNMIFPFRTYILLLNIIITIRINNMRVIPMSYNTYVLKYKFFFSITKE